MGYFITAFFTVFTGVILWLIKRDRVSLLYDVSESDIFTVNGGLCKYFIIKIINNGNKHLENINLSICFNTDKIESVSTSNSEILVETVQDDKSFKTIISLLNPKECFSLTLTKKVCSGEQSPKISARAVGATAVLKKDDISLEHINKIGSYILIPLVAMVGLTSWNSFRAPEFENKLLESMKQDSSKVENALSELEKSTSTLHEKLRIETEKNKAGNPKTEQVIFSILNKNGLTHVLPEIMEKSGENVTYWKTGILLVFKFSADIKNRQKYIAAMEDIVNLDNGYIAPSSRGFNLYLLSRMHRQLGNTVKANDLLSLCKTETPLMYNHLMKQDGFFDLRGGPHP